jgi:hypothetical protein
MNPPTAWVALELQDPVPQQVLSRFEKALPGLGESRTFVLPGDLGFYDARNRELIAGFNRWMLELFRAVIPPGGFLHVVDPDLNHTGYRFFPHVPVEAGAALEQWWGFVEYLQGAVWTVPLLPDGDSYYFVSPAFDFGFLSIYSVTGPSEIVFAGEPLCRGLRSPDLPELLQRLSEAGTRR